MNFLTDIVSFWCNKNYERVLKRLRKDVRSRKIRVLFYVTENSKWGYQSLYEIMDKSDVFEPFVVAGMLKEAYNGKDKTRFIVQENFEFFKSRGMNVKLGFENGKFVDLKTFAPDIIFYDQPWGLLKSQKSQSVCRYALTCICPYSFEIFNCEFDYTQGFQHLIFRNFIDSDLNIERYESYRKGNSKNCTAVGYPKLDAYLDNSEIDLKKYWKNPEKFKIIYAPHHSFEKGGLEAATFRENGMFMLDFARKNADTTWVFKPHPRLKLALVQNGIMTEAEVEEYYRSWEEIGKVYLQGDYIDIFKSSDLMITDCCSFLAEYLPSTKPLIRPMNPNVIALNKLGEEVVKGYWQVYSEKEFLDAYNQIFVEKNDDKKLIREEVAKNIIDSKEKSSQKIVNHLLELLKVKDK